MKCPAFVTAIVLPLALASALRAAEPGVGTALLDRVIQFPGSYAQVCDVMTSTSDLPYRAYQLSGFAGASFSKVNLATMQANRAEMVKAIRARLLEIDLVRKAEETKKDPAPEESYDGDDVGCDPKVLNPLLLDAILTLQATEALPELLALEAKLVAGIAKAKNDAKAAPPMVAGWWVGEEGREYDENEPEAKRDRRVQLFQSRVAQRDLVILIGKLLREKKYEPYLATALEKAYVKGIRKEAQALGIADYKPGKPLPKDKEHLELTLDPVSKVPVDAYTSIAIPYSRESRDEVRAAAEKWIKEKKG
ncbi:hypothetical protein OKA04_05700 [Luteolibacter flavescens]|uniref:Uncharacterized protein n=1 Tax=Luteolibacter flavescens TaxID=1859460 RepID=A0ABT3FKV1_9BACT|nr:hypothetical protein [Luteolibacter flavescens]MCW1884216.1 hypothetical protein [Luteolibacter flavescens]